jgi:hypothetical protein
MKIKEVLSEAGVVAPVAGKPAAPGTAAPGETPGQEGQDIGKLTATVTALQKQVQDLQKAALQTTAAQQQQAKPGQAGQQQQAQGTVGSSTGNQTPLGNPQAKPMGQQPAQQAQQSPQGQQPQQGQQPAAQQPAKTPPQPIAPGVNQPPQITNMKIKQDLSQKQGGGSV